ncbi:MAG: hypothetical protein HRT35_37425, partial [Algicola sp.]|nr:hypothetical protein [Algicola sp.]
NKFSCTAHDKGNHDTHKSVRLECPSGQRIRHTSDPDSEIYLSSDCDDDVSRVRAVRAQGKGKSGKGAVKFRSRHSSAKDYLQKYEHGCYQYITLRGGQEMRIMLGDSYSKANCKGITTK